MAERYHPIRVRLVLYKLTLMSVLSFCFEETVVVREALSPLLSSIMTVNPQQLSLSLPRSEKVSKNGFPSYRSTIHHYGQKLVIKTPDVECLGLQTRMTNGTCSLTVPIDSWTRSQLNELEYFVQHNVVIPDDVLAPAGSSRDYRPLWPYPVTYIMCSQWCNYFWKNPETGMCLSVSPEQLTQPGLFSFSIELPYVYIGPHKGGERFSLSWRLLQVTYTPLRKEELSCAIPPPPEPEKETTTHPGQRIPALPNLTIPPPQTHHSYVSHPPPPPPPPSSFKARPSFT